MASGSPRAMARCPFCFQDVVAQRNAQGKLVCPECGNRGAAARTAPAPAGASAPWAPNPPAPTPAAAWNAQAAWPGAPGPAVPPPTPGERVPGALAALVLGIMAYFTWFLGIVPAILAIVWGSRAQRRIRDSGGRLSGNGMALAGKILGIVWLCLVPVVIVLASVVFVLVTKISGAGVTHDQTVSIEPGHGYLRAFRVNFDHGVVTYTYAATGGHAVQAYLVPAVSLSDPHPADGRTWGSASGSNANVSVVLERGTYSIRLACASQVTCTVRYTLAVTDLPAVSGASPPTPGAAPDCAPTSVPTQGDASQLPAWQPATTMPAGSYIYTESSAGDYIGEGGRQLYTPANDTLRVYQTGRVLHTEAVHAWWRGDFQVPDRCPRPMAGYYTGLTRQPFANPKVGGLAWGGQGKDCNEIAGSMAIDEIAYDVDGTMTSLTLRFEQHCERASAPALMGKVHWTINPA